MPQLYLSGYSVFPNPSNGLRVEKTFILPDPQNEAFRHDLREQYSKLGVPVSFVDSFQLHQRQGNLHALPVDLRLRFFGEMPEY